MKRGTYVSRSAYQVVCEENKKLINDLKIICCGEPSMSIQVEMKWAKHFEKEKQFSKILTEVAKEYLKEHPEYDITSPHFRSVGKKNNFKKDDTKI